MGWVRMDSETVVTTDRVQYVLRSATLTPGTVKKVDITELFQKYPTLSIPNFRPIITNISSTSVSQTVGTGTTITASNSGGGLSWSGSTVGDKKYMIIQAPSSKFNTTIDDGSSTQKVSATITFDFIFIPPSIMFA